MNVDYTKNEKLGLPPMQLAEPFPKKGFCSKFIDLCLTPCMRSFIGTLVLASICVLTYLMIFSSLQETEGQTKLIIIGVQDVQNITAHKGHLEILLKYENTTFVPYKIRRKRSLRSFPTKVKQNSSSEPILADKDMVAARNIILNHNELCDNKNKDEICKELVTELKSVSKRQTAEALSGTETGANSKQMDLPRNTYEHQYPQPSYQVVAPPSYPALPVQPAVPILSPQLADTCLLARLLKDKVPHVHVHPAMYDVPQTYIAPQYAPVAYPHTSINYPSYIHPTYHQARDAIEDVNRGHTPHPQDIAISMRFTTTERPKADHRPSLRDSSCPFDTMSCDNGDTCVSAKQWCDGTVDCNDASDEARCSCVSRVDSYRLCDGYFDCPFGEDEMGCYGCAAQAFSCEDLDLNSHTTCFTKEQRCNNIIDCPNQKDEADCNLLSNSLHQLPPFAVSNTEGFLQRNFKGDWYPVCSNPYMWAHDACRRETGLIIRPPFIQLVPIDPLLKVTYINTNTAGIVQTSDTCANSSAVYVTCPDLLCGTRVLTTPQLLRENAAFENRLFGRNKRFLLQEFGYPVVYFGNRRKRHFNNVTNLEEKDDKRIKRSLFITNDDHNLSKTKNLRESDDEFKTIDDLLLGESSKVKKDVFKSNEDQYEFKTNDLKETDDGFQINENIKLRKPSKVKRDLRDRRAQTRVVGGKPSQPAAWPWMVAMLRDGKFHCGGVLLNRRWVVSAAHCVTKFWEHYYEIQIGMLRRFSFSPQEHSLRVTHVIVNQNYDKIDMKNDLSLLRVEPEIQFSRWVRPICLPGPETAGPEWLWGPQPGTTCYAVGWGATEEHGPDPDHIREVEVPVWSQCKHREDRAGKEICAGLMEGGKDACQGDSGGPLLCKNPLNSAQWYIAGIVSHGDGCARKGEPGVYTRVSLYVKWIKHHVSSKTLPAIQPRKECPGFKCMSGISKCLSKDKQCDKIVDCLDGEDELNCNFPRNSDHLIVDLFDTGIRNREAEKEYLKTKEADDENISREATSADFAHASTIEMPNDEDSENTKSAFRDASEEFTARTTTGSEEPNIHRGDMTTSTEDLHSSPSEQMTREMDITEDWSDFISTTVQTVTDLQKSKAVNQTPTTIAAEMTETFTNKIIKTDLTETTTHLTQTEVTTQTLKDQIIETATELVVHKNDEINNNTKPFEINIPINVNLRNSSTNLEPVISIDDLKHAANKTISEMIIHSNKSINTENQTEKHKLVPHRENEHFNKDVNSKDHKNVTKPNLLPANNRQQRRIPENFICNRINQVIPFKFRCDHKADCEDGSDEIGCTCVDYVTTFDQKLICDGTIDCADGQDEFNCFGCVENQFLCKRSKQCLSIKHVCDGRLDCPDGEDELDCFALTNGRNLILDFDGKPQINLEGFLTKRHENNWNIVCEDNLTLEQQETAASHVCRYLGFSSANRLLVKYINVKDEKLETKDARKRREKTIIPTQFARQVFEEDKVRQDVIKDVQIIKEECVPNITRTCMSLYVFCEHTLFNNELLHFEIEDNELSRSSDTVWPWVAKVYVEGIYKCSGILIDVSWVLISHSCLWDSLTPKDHTTVILGTQRVLKSTHGPYEQIYQVDAKKEWLNSKVTLLHLHTPAHYTSMVKPMAVSAFMHDGERQAVCVAVGEDNNNNTVNVLLEESNEDCHYPDRCFKRHSNRSLCQPGTTSNRLWAGVISCHGTVGWHPSASFVVAGGECGMGERVVATDIGNLRSDIKHYLATFPSNLTELSEDSCEGERCARGRCIKFEHLCDGVRHCEDGLDEEATACEKKHAVCGRDPYHGGCECSSDQLKCRNGRCLSKQQFSDGKDDCGDGSDEPGHVSCAQYLARTMPNRLCDGVLHCHDKSDEDPMFCKCFSTKSVKCGSSEHCVSSDVVCDGSPDCPHGEDEQTCLALSSQPGTKDGTGIVISCSHGIWHTKCYPNQQHTRTELEKICRQLGYISGHAKQLMSPTKVGPKIKIHLESFQEVSLNNNTSIKLRSSNRPLARAIYDNSMEQCYPVNIECL